MSRSKSHHASEPKGLTPEEENEYKSSMNLLGSFCNALAQSTGPLSKKNPVLSKVADRAQHLFSIVKRFEECTNPPPVKAYYVGPLVKRQVKFMGDALAITNVMSPTVDGETLKRWKRDEKESIESRCRRVEILLSDTRDIVVSSVVGIDARNPLAPFHEDHLSFLAPPDDVRAFDEKKDFGRLEDLIIAYHKACGEPDNVHFAFTQMYRAALSDRLVRFFCDNKNDHRHMTQFAEKYQYEHMNQGVVMATCKMFLYPHSPQHLRKPWCKKTVKNLGALPPEIALHAILAIRESAMFFKDKALAEELAEALEKFDPVEASHARFLPEIIAAIRADMPKGGKKKGSSGGGGSARGGKHGKDDGSGGSHGGGSEEGSAASEQEHGSGRRKKGGKKVVIEEDSKHGGKHGKKKGGKHHEEDPYGEHPYGGASHEEDEGILNSITTSFGHMWASIVGSGDEASGDEGSNSRGSRKKKSAKKGGKHHDDEGSEGSGGSHGGKKKGRGKSSSSSHGKESHGKESGHGHGDAPDSERRRKKKSSGGGGHEESDHLPSREKKGGRGGASASASASGGGGRRRKH